MPKKIVSLTFAFVLILAATGCSTVARYQFRRAQALEASGKAEQALQAYTSLLTYVPRDDGRMRSMAYLRIGECLWKLDRISEALGAMQKAAEADNSNAAAHARLGEIYLAGGAPDRARDQAHSILQLASASLEGLTLLGAASSAAGDDNLAEQAFTKVLASDPQRVSVAVALADVYDRQDNVDKARQVLRKASIDQPSSAMPWLALGRLEEQEGDPAAAENAYRQAVQAEDSVESNLRLAQFLERAAKLKDAEDALRRADSLRLTMPVAFADFKLLAGDADSALDRYTTALRSPIFDRRKHERFGWARVQSGESKEQANNRAAIAARIVEADLELASKVSAQNPAIPVNTDAAKLHFNQYRSEWGSLLRAILQAEIALSDNDLTAAGNYAEKALAFSPDSPPAHYVRGVVRSLRGDKAGARAEWLSCVNNDSGYMPARIALADLALRDNDSKGAESFIIDVVREEPGNIRALLLFARALAAEHRYASAELIARRAVVLDANLAEPHLILGNIALARNDVANALMEYERAVVLDPRSREAMQGLTSVYTRGTITRPMLAELERVANMPPASAPLLEIAARIYSDHGWYSDARRCLVRAMKIDPQRKTAATLLATLRASTGDYAGALNTGGSTGGSRGALFRAIRAEDRHDTEVAVAQYEQAVREGEPTGVAANNLAWILAQQGRDLDHALDLALRAQSLAPENVAVLDTLGFVYLKRREYTKAVSLLKSAHELALRRKTVLPELSSIRQHLSEAYLRTGQIREAASVLSPKLHASRKTGGGIQAE